jgi:predicted dehydrogenase
MKNIIKKILKLLAEKIGYGVDRMQDYRKLREFQRQMELKEVAPLGTIWIVGCGRMGIQFLNAIKSSKGLRLGGLIDYNVDNIPNLIAKMKLPEVPYGKDLNLLKEAGFNLTNDVLIIATTADSHFSLTEVAINMGVKKILLEKPLTTSIAEGHALIKLVKDNQVNLYVDHTRRWMVTFQSLRKLLASGIIGKPESLTMPYGESGVAMIGSHLFDLCRFILDAEIVSVSSSIDQTQKENKRGARFYDPTGNFRCLLSNGVVADLYLSNALSKRHNLLYIVGSKGRIEVDFEIEQLRIVTSAGMVYEKPFPFQIDRKNALNNIIFDLLKGAAPICSIHDGLQALEAVIAAMESAEHNGVMVHLPLSEEIVNKKFSFA